MGRRSSEKRARRERRLKQKREWEGPDMPQIHLVPEPWVHGTRLPVVRLDADDVIYSLDTLKMIGPAEQHEADWLGVMGYPFRLEARLTLKIDGKDRRVWYDPLELFRNLGKTCKISPYGREGWLVPPSPDLVVNVLEKLRLDALTIMRARLGGIENFEAAFRDPDILREFEHAQAIGIDAVEYAMVLDCTNGSLGPAASLNLLSMNIMVANHLITWCRKQYDLLLPDHESWVRGRAAESALLATRFSPRETWPQVLQEAYAELEVEAPKLGRMVPPGAGDPAPDVPQEDAPKRVGKRRVWDPDRLLFYMGLDEYVEPRALETGDRFGYIAVCFTGNRVGLDTAQTNNRFFGLEGDLEECLQLARLTKSEIRASPLCTLPLIHDPEGTWKTKVRRWLRGELDRS